ncbi:hypothetical protein BHF71_05885 [Vulcanibacillus modesticaldus]|uniref:YetF C-terminal domain-containing protein n=1 Tax=Vulcanibacillus modesticaldus TaxID=337097 RepID=A0A1D2YX30_9BACI|nr:DUF421 domain-containing protein [Vulcanibacillus modesticaldus]OEG00216.1 hypothetical protein BHF71_05885 [Vulcanibacillus modesticaldus]
MESFSIALYRTLFMYFFVLIVLRLMGKREIGKLSIFDLVVSIMMAEIAVVVIEDTEISMIRGIVPILALMFTQIIISYISLKSKKIRELVEGKPVILISNGKIRDKEMARQRYTLDDLLTQLREKNIKRIADVELAILETSGKLSVFPKPSQLPVYKGDLNIALDKYKGMPIPLVADGRILSKNLKKIDRDDQWLMKQLAKKGYRNLDDVYFASIGSSGELFIDPKDG